jgi:hypothetical protein
MFLMAHRWERSSALESAEKKNLLTMFACGEP